MRFNSYIIDENTKEEKLAKALENIKKDCQPFINEYRRSGTKELLYRGTNKKVKDFKKIRPREDRYPKDTPGDIQDLLDGLFKRYHGIKPRSTGVFTTGNWSDAKTYGTAYIFIPAGDYKYIWSPDIHDLYGDVVNVSDYREYFSDDFDYWTESQYSDMYLEEYGEGSGNGTWVAYYKRNRYESDDADRDNAIIDIVDQIMNDKKFYDVEKYEDEDEIRDRIMDDIDGSIQWEPNVNDVMRYCLRLKDEQEGQVIDIIKKYKMKDLKKAIESFNEVTFICKYYYLFSLSLEEMVKDLLSPQKQLTFRWGEK